MGSSKELPEAHYKAQNDNTITEGGEPVTRLQNTNSIDVNARLSLPEIRTGLHVRDSINTANETIKKIKEEHNKLFTLTELNQIVYVTALIITEQIGLGCNKCPRSHKCHKQNKQLEITG